jgi:hypothetical protein
VVTTTESPPPRLLETLSVTFTTRTKSRSRSSIPEGRVRARLEVEGVVCSRTEDEAGVLLVDRSVSGVDVEVSRLEEGAMGDLSEVDGELIVEVDEVGAVTVVGTR